MGVLQQISEELESLVARTAPSVVGVEHADGQGAGLVLASDGYILTNSHVVRARRSSVRIRAAGDVELHGRVVGTDPRTDLAVLVATASNLPALPLARLARINVGQLVVAIGNPFRFERSVTLGVISALDRFLPGPRGSALEGLIQTDAAINPGNSGGPLVNMRGEVVGINTATIQYAQGIGFAVPAQTADWVASVLIQHGTIERPTMGISARSEELAAALAREIGQSRGVRVLAVESGSPAAAAGMRDGDIVIALDGELVASVDDMQRVMVLRRRQELRITVMRATVKRELPLRLRMASAAA